MNETNTIEAQSQKQNSQSNIFMILGIVFLVLGAIIFLLQLLLNDNISMTTTDLPTHSAFVIGIVIVKLVIVTAVFVAALFMFKKKKGLIAMIVSILFLIAAIITTTSAFAARSKENRLNKAAMNKIISMSRDFVDNKDLDDTKLEESKYGSITPFLNLSNQYFVSYKKLSTDMNADIKEFNVSSIVSANTFTSSANIISAQQKIQVLMNKLDKYELDADKTSKNMSSDVSKLDIPIRYKEDLVNGFAKGQLKSSASLKKYVTFEKGFLKIIDTNMSFMLKSKKNYTVKNNLIYFKNFTDMSTYNIYLTDLRTKVAQEVIMLNEIKSDNNKQLDNLEDLNK